jgi:tetratricopeptide (TPR) repeat protein
MAKVGGMKVAIDGKCLNSLPPVIAYARLLRELQRLADEGKADSQEAEAVTELMDAPWYAMTDQEQSRMRGLSADLYALREGGPKRTELNRVELATWQQKAKETFARSETEPDAALNLLRQPVPSQLPPQFVPFLQARCWERLGDLETALVFMKEADRLGPDPLSVLLLLQNLDRSEEVLIYANKVIANANSTPLELYLAAVALISQTRKMRKEEVTPTLQQAVTVLRKALAEYRSTPWQELSDADIEIAQALALGLERLGDVKAAINVYSEAIKRNPNSADLYAGRGHALYETDQQAALSDFVRAVHFGAVTIWPYLFLARHAIQGGVPLEALRLALLAENQPGPPPARAEVYAIIGMAQFELRQPAKVVLESFDRALALDPKNELIQENRNIAATSIQSPSQRVKPKHPLQASQISRENLLSLRTDQLKNRLELFNERRQERVSMELAV